MLLSSASRSCGVIAAICALALSILRFASSGVSDSGECFLSCGGGLPCLSLSSRRNSWFNFPISSGGKSFAKAFSNFSHQGSGRGVNPAFALASSRSLNFAAVVASCSRECCSVCSHTSSVMGCRPHLRVSLVHLRSGCPRSQLFSAKVSEVLLLLLFACLPLDPSVIIHASIAGLAEST